eukprot:GSMAST32.ASY1.ANO1.157.1 assembled CDS
MGQNPGGKQEPRMEPDQHGEQVQERFLEFLFNFTEGGENDNPEYEEQLLTMRQNDHTTLFVDFQHVLQHDPTLARAVLVNYYRYDPYLRKAIQNFVHKEFFISIYNLSEVERVRELRTEKIGQLVAITATVTRTSEVRPELIYGCFTCQECSAEVDNPKICPNGVCNATSWNLDIARSKFVDWQRLRVQENSDEIPPGSMPRSFDVVLRCESVERAKAGDKVILTGSLIVLPDVAQLMRPGEGAKSSSRGQSRGDSNYGQGVTGLKALDGVSSFLSCPAGMDVRMEDVEEGAEVDVTLDFTETQRDVSMKRTPHIYSKMAQSLAPDVFGHDEVKRGILLMLFGGVHKKTQDGGKLRGDINVCVVGDPSTAKSQFLKYVSGFMPRAIYTSGKASSAAGLTAAVLRDPDTGEFYQVAIHEAMEQQTISITKAGIQATLNARASILAAANPIYTLRQNIQMSAPIMSRFDLFFVVLDDCDDLHQGIAATNDNKVMVECYRRLRQNDTAARLHLDDTVRPSYVMEAYRLLKKSIIHVESADVDFSEMADAMEDANEKANNPNNDHNDANNRNNKSEDENEAAENNAPSASCTYEKYQRVGMMYYMMALHLRGVEDTTGKGMMQKDLVAWCLRQHVDELETEAQLSAEQRLFNLIIEKLVVQDRVFLVAPEKTEKKKKSKEYIRNHRILLVHPNFTFD